MSIEQRKREHADLCASTDVSYLKGNGFETYDFVHDALPEIDPVNVSIEASLLGREFSFPLFISSMTGGYAEAGGINEIIAEFCQEHNLPFGVGSQRAMLENPLQESSFSIVRKSAPDAFIAANIGGSQLIGGLRSEWVDRMIDSIAADAVIVHLNPLQELVQPGGDHTFEGIEEGIAHLASNTPVPIIVKETGAGVSGSVAQRLLAMGVQVIDVAGAGGTSWSRVENVRNKGGRTEKKTPFEPFEEWGIPTTVCIEQIHVLRKQFRFELIASGGIRSPFDMAKAMALGADFTAAAQPVIAAIFRGGRKELEILLEEWVLQFRMILTLLGCRSVKQLGHSHIRRVVG